MAGFMGALAAVARIGGEVGVQNIDRRKEELKHQREMQLQQLRDQFLGSQNAMQIEFQKGEGIANRASQEKLTNAQLATNERLGQLAANTSRYSTDVNAATTKDVAEGQVALGREELTARIDQYKAQIASTEKVAGEQLAGQKEIAGSQIAAQKDIAEFTEEARQKLGITERLDAKGKVILMRPDGTKVPLPKDENGKEIDLASPDTSTPEMKNLAALMSIPGMTQQKAVDYIYGAKADSPTQIQMDFFEAMSKSKPFGTTTEDLQNWYTLSGQFRDMTLAAREAAAGTAPPAATPGAAPGATAAPVAGATSAAAPPAAPAAPAAAGTVAPPAPTNQADRVPGQTYTTPNGNVGIWTGTGWRMTGPAAAATGSPPSG